MIAWITANPLAAALAVLGGVAVLWVARPYVRAVLVGIAGAPARAVRGGALKLVGESYPFESSGQYLLTFDNHNSVNGIREFARAKGAQVTYGNFFYNAVGMGRAIDLTSADVNLNVLPTFHAGGLGLYAGPIFHAGGTLVVDAPAVIEAADRAGLFLTGIKRSALADAVAE